MFFSSGIPVEDRAVLEWPWNQQRWSQSTVWQHWSYFQLQSVIIKDGFTCKRYCFLSIPFTVWSIDSLLSAAFVWHFIYICSSEILHLTDHSHYQCGSVSTDRVSHCSLLKPSKSLWPSRPRQLSVSRDRNVYCCGPDCSLSLCLPALLCNNSLYSGCQTPRILICTGKQLSHFTCITKNYKPSLHPNLSMGWSH